MWYAIQRGNMSNAIAVHVHETEHPVDWDSVRVIEREKYFACRKIKESLHIKRSVNCINWATPHSRGVSPHIYIFYESALLLLYAGENQKSVSFVIRV